MKNTINQEYLVENFLYNPLDGLLIKRKNKKVCGWENNFGYLQVQILKRKYLVHRLAFLYVHGVFPENQIDHINGDKKDNRISNLRDVNNSVNNRNRITSKTKNSATGKLGILLYKRTGKYKAQMSINGKDIHIGYFNSVKEAEYSYKEFSTKHNIELPAG